MEFNSGFKGLMAGGRNVMHGTPETSASVLPLQSGSKCYGRTTQRAKL